MAGLIFVGSGMAHGQDQILEDRDPEGLPSFGQTEDRENDAIDRSGIADPQLPLAEEENQNLGGEREASPGETEDQFDIKAAPPIDLDTEREACREDVDAYMDDLAITFASGSARMAPGSERVLVELSDILGACPNVPLFVEGHTDADGSDALNLTLSLARAEAVVEDLIELGIAPGRLYAVGYGSGLPIASNDTAAGKALNRRIVFNFEDIAEPLEGEGS